MKCQILCFWEKNKKNITNLSSAELAKIRLWMVMPKAPNTSHWVNQQWENYEGHLLNAHQNCSLTLYRKLWSPKKNNNCLQDDDSWNVKSHFQRKTRKDQLFFLSPRCWQIIQIDSFSTMFYKEDIFCDFLFAAPKVPSEKVSSLKGMNSLPRGTNSFLSK